MSGRPDFEALRAKRNAAVAAEMKSIADEYGFDLSQCHTSFNPDSCYCACASGGPCEHDFQGWREFEDGRGGEQVCKRCGCGAMGHTLSMGM